MRGYTFSVIAGTVLIALGYLVMTAGYVHIPVLSFFVNHLDRTFIIALGLLFSGLLLLLTDLNVRLQAQIACKKVKIVFVQHLILLQ